MKKSLDLFDRNQYHKVFERVKSFKEYEVRNLDKSYKVKAQYESTNLVKRYIYKFIVFWDHPRTVEKLILLF